MAKVSTITIDRIEVNKRNVEKVRKIFGAKNNVEAIQKALDLTAGKIELEAIFDKYLGTSYPPPAIPCSGTGKGPGGTYPPSDLERTRS